MADVETSFFSLADLAALNTDDIAALASRTPPAGVFQARIKLCEGKQTTGRNAQGEESENAPPNINFNFQYEILSGKVIDKSIDIEKDVVGRIFRESYKIWTGDEASVRESIGLIKGRYEKVGLSTKGVMGGMEGKDPGWFDAALEQVINLKVVTGVRNGQERAFFDWVKPTATSAAA